MDLPPCETLQLYDCRMTAGQQAAAYGAVFVVVSIIVLVGLKIYWELRRNAE